MKTWLVLAMMLPLAACRLTLHGDPGSVEPVAAAVPAPEIYSRADIDAINAAAQCRAMARTMVQMARCDVHR